ncbi:AEC family transporter [Paludibacterium paludis]|uniref:AEC family transporter n=1 Tax=Paludibacterium paludis TaxID=1225769 RepID=A0A918P140_9NEIS|nr:hypothetical protein [Paludibacterium paludis]GGY11252.1 hypothetical protein GCM10011289_12710 [Paludibacterium paludis]
MSLGALAILLPKLLPPGVYVGAGYVARRTTSLSQAGVGKALLYVFVPLTVFKGALQSDTGAFLTLCGLSFAVSAMMALTASLFVRHFARWIAAGTLRCAFGYFNIGWFGVPIAQALYGTEGMLAMTAMYVGGMLFGNTVGYALMASDRLSPGHLAGKLLSLPALPCALAAFGLRAAGFATALSQNAPLSGLLEGAALITSVLGMALVGMSVAGVSLRRLPWNALFGLLVSRVLCAAVLTVILIGACGARGWLTPLEIRVFALMPLLPIAANLLVFTSALKTQSEFVGMALLGSTLGAFVLLVVRAGLPVFADLL